MKISRYETVFRGTNIRTRILGRSAGALISRMATKRIPLNGAGELHDDYIVHLIRSQIAFGLAYLEEARLAYGESRGEFGEVAREIVLNSYHSAVRFAARLARDLDSTIHEQLDRLRCEMHAVWPDAAHSREIA